MRLSVISTLTILIISPLLLFAAQYDSLKVEVLAQRAEHTVQLAYMVLWDYKVQSSIADTVRDPNNTGVIGIEYSPLTTTIGYEKAKELSTQAGWASWLVKEMIRRGIDNGDKIAVSMSGSFPALNIAVFAALQELSIEVKCISSIGASSWGANEIGLSWPEMERILQEKDVLKTGSNAVTLGGTGDRGAEWDETTKELAVNAVKRSLLPLIKNTKLKDAVKKRMRFYGNPDDYFCYINVGGGQASLGGGAKLRFNRGGWFEKPLPDRGKPDGVMDKFLFAGIPCLNLLFLEKLDNNERITIK